MTSTKTDYSDRIPEYHHGLLDSQANALFEQELEKNIELREELDEFVQFQQLYHEVESEEPRPSPANFEAILSSIASHDQEEERCRGREQRSSLQTQFLQVWGWLKESVSIPWTVALVQTVAIVLLILPGSDQESFTTLSRTSSTDKSLPTTSFNVVFAESTQEVEIRKLLQSIGGSITSGPSAKGRYVIVLSSDKTVDEAVDILKESSIVTFSAKAY